MTRLFTDGAETGGITVVTGYSGPDFTASTVAKRSGAYSYALGRETTDTAFYQNTTSASEVYVRFGVYMNQATGTQHIFQFRSGTNNIASVTRETTNQFFQVGVAGTPVATGTIRWEINTWYLLEMYILISDSGRLILKVDGITDIDYSGDTYTSYSTGDNIYFSDCGTTNAAITYFDDIAINNTSGTEDNGWCGDGRVILIRPISDGDISQLTPSSGSAHYALVDEIPYNTTDYVSSSVIDSYDLYNIADPAVSASSTITRVWAVGYVAGSVATGGKISLGLKTNDTEYWSSDYTVLTSYAVASGSSYTLNPQTGLPWTLSEINALQAGIKIRGTA